MTRAKELLDAATPLPWPAWDSDTVRIDLPEPEARLALYAVNRLPDYEAAVDALERLVNIQDPKDYSPAWDAGRAALRRLRDEVPS